MRGIDCNGELYTKCDICDSVINYKQYRGKSHMKSDILGILKPQAIIPDLCSERCCDKYLKIIQNY